MKIRIAALFAAAFCLSGQVFAEVSLTTGAGYADMAKELAKAFTATSGTKVTQNFGGNIGQMMAQIANGNGANIVISDEGTLKNLKSPIQLTDIHALGNTPLVFIWRKGLDLKGVSDIETNKVKQFAYPDPKAAVYGRAAQQYLNNLGLKAVSKDKIMKIASVPQVTAYVVKGEVDAGFVNRTAARRNKDKIGGSEEVTKGYEPIHMIAAVVKGHEGDKDVQQFLTFLQSEQAKTILLKHGIQ